MVFVDRGGAPALAERGLTFGGGGACEWRQGSTPRCQSPGPAPLTVTTACTSHLATSTLPLRAPLPEVCDATFAERLPVSEGGHWNPDTEREGGISGLGLGPFLARLPVPSASMTFVPHGSSLSPGTPGSGDSDLGSVPLTIVSAHWPAWGPGLGSSFLLGKF